MKPSLEGRVWNTGGWGLGVAGCCAYGSVESGVLGGNSWAGLGVVGRNADAEGWEKLGDFIPREGN